MGSGEGEGLRKGLPRALNLPDALRAAFPGEFTSSGD